MENKEIILQELKQLSPTLASVGSIQPYQVPADYFETLANEVLDRIKEDCDEKVDLPLLREDQKKLFDTPDSYFEGLSGTIISRIKALEALSPADELNALSPLLVQLDKTPPFSKPQEYFEELPSDILAGVNAIDFVNHELETLPFILSAVKKENIYKIPDNYFKNFPGQLLNKVSRRKKGAFRSPGFVKTMARYAVAAFVSGAVALGGWQYFHNNNAATAGTDFDGIDRIIGNKKISDDEIINYLEYDSTATFEINSRFADLKEEEVKELLADVSEEELQQYLEQHSVSKDLENN